MTALQLKETLDLWKLDRAQFALLVGVEKRTIEGWFSGRTIPSPIIAHIRTLSALSAKVRARVIGLR